jgi:hypothetical protein
MTNEKWKIFGLLLRIMILESGPARNACPTNTTTPHGVNCMAQWGEKTGKLRIQIIVGRGAYVHLIL